MRIVRKRHPFFGRSLQVFGWMRRHGRLDLILVLPDGSRSLVPASWTDFGADAAEPSHEMLASLTDLQRLRVVIDGLVHRSRDATRDDVAPDQGEVVRAAPVTTERRGGDPRGVDGPRDGKPRRGHRAVGPGDGERRRGPERYGR